MSTAQFIMREIRRRALHLRLRSAIANNGEMIERSEAQRIAAKEIAQEQRRRPKRADARTTGQEQHVTIGNARQALINKVMAIGERLRDGLAAQPSGNTPSTAAAVVSLGPGVRLSPPPFVNMSGGDQPREQPPSNQTLVFASNGSGVELIPDSEFHNSVRDLTTESWRRSIIEARERAARRGMKWIG
jgi:hypothetical protein